MEETNFSIRIAFTFQFPFMRKDVPYGELDLKVNNSTTFQELRTMIQIECKNFSFKGKYFMFNEDEKENETTMEEAGVKNCSEIFLNNIQPSRFTIKKTQNKHKRRTYTKT